MPDVAQGEAAPEHEDADRTLAELFAVTILTNASVSQKELAQLCRYAGIDETTITASNTYAREHLVKGGADV